MQIFMILALIVAIVAAAFAWQNPGIVSVHFLKWQFDGSQALVCLAVFAMGFLAHFLISLTNMIRYRWLIYRLKKRVDDLEEKLADKEKRPVIDLPPEPF